MIDSSNSEVGAINSSVIDNDTYNELAQLGTATIHEASGGEGLVDMDLIQIVPGSRVAGPTRIAYCGQDDNRAVHEVMLGVQPGDVLVLCMPKPTPVALFGELLCVQALQRRVAGVLVDAAVRDTDILKSLGLPVWARFVRVRGTKKERTMGIDVPVTVGGCRIEPQDVVIMDSDGAVTIARNRVPEVLEAARSRERKEAEDRAAFEAGMSSWQLYGYGPADHGQ